MYETVTRNPVSVKLTLAGYSDTVGQMIDLPIARDVARMSAQTNGHLRNAWQVARDRLAIDYLPVSQVLRIRAIELVLADRSMCDSL